LTADDLASVESWEQARALLGERAGREVGPDVPLITARQRQRLRQDAASVRAVRRALTVARTFPQMLAPEPPEVAWLRSAVSPRAGAVLSTSALHQAYVETLPAGSLAPHPRDFVRLAEPILGSPTHLRTGNAYLGWALTP
jgi:hypothetical protein